MPGEGARTFNVNVYSFKGKGSCDNVDNIVNNSLHINYFVKGSNAGELVVPNAGIQSK